MPNGYSDIEYGPHKYRGDGWHWTDCEYGCGCSANDCRSNSPRGVDPFGMCPGNPVEGKFIDGGSKMTEDDIDNVVKQRIFKLEMALYKARAQLRRGVWGLITDRFKKTIARMKKNPTK